MSKEELLRTIIPGAEHLDLFSADKVLGADTSRQAHAYPIYDLTYAKKTSLVLDALEKIEDSVTCGDRDYSGTITWIIRLRLVNTLLLRFWAKLL